MKNLTIPATFFLAALAALPLCSAEPDAAARSSEDGPKAEPARHGGRQARQRLRRHEGPGKHRDENARPGERNSPRTTPEEREARRADRRARHDGERHRRHEPGKNGESGNTPAPPAP